MEEPAEKWQKLGDDRQSEERTPAATSQEDQSCFDEVLSDSEDERKQCAVAIASIDALVATEHRTEEDNAKAANRPKDESRIELLLLARRLVQIHSEGDSQPAPDDLSLAAAKAAGKNEHPERDDAGTGQGSVGDVAGPLVPQAREFMASKGFKSFDEVKDGQTLVVHCCYDSKTRILAGP